MEINGYTLALIGGDLHISQADKLIMKTKGDPRKKGNPAFASLEAAAEYFNTTGYAQPPFVDDGTDPDAPTADPAV